MKKEKPKLKNERLIPVIQSLSRKMPEITSDDVHQELMKFGVPPDEIFRAVGSLLKIAQKRNWIQKSGRAATSQRNRGGTVHIWKSCNWKGGGRYE